MTVWLLNSQYDDDTMMYILLHTTRIEVFSLCIRLVITCETHYYTNDGAVFTSCDYNNKYGKDAMDGCQKVHVLHMPYDWD